MGKRGLAQPLRLEIHHRPRSLVTKYFAKGVLRGPGSGCHHPTGSPHVTLYLPVDGLRRGARTFGSSCVWRRCLSISAICRASNMECSKYSNCRQHDSNLFHRATLLREFCATSHSSIPVTVMPIPVVTTMLVRDIRVSAVPVARHAWRFGTAWRLAKAVDILGRVRTVIWQTLRH